MRRTSTKAAAERILHELPSVQGAFVRENIHGNPREIHVLVGPGTTPRHLAHDIRDLLEEHLGIPIDQRVISIAQLRAADDQPAARLMTPHAGGADPAAPPAEADSRVVFAGLDTKVEAGRVTVEVRLRWRELEHTADAGGMDSPGGRARAAATATLAAAQDTSGGAASLQLGSASVIRALDRDYVLVSALVRSPALGRRPTPVVGAHPAEIDVETAAALAALKAINRLLGFLLDGDTRS